MTPAQYITHALRSTPHIEPYHTRAGHRWYRVRASPPGTIGPARVIGCGLTVDEAWEAAAEHVVIAEGIRREERKIKAMSEHTSDDDPETFGLVCPFWIDTDAYTDRDRAMFVAGIEFGGILRHIRFESAPMESTIHRENESRIRMAAGRFKRACHIAACEAEHDPEGVWSYLAIEAKGGHPA